MIGNIIGWGIGAIGVILALYFEYRRDKYPKRMKFYVLDAVRLTSPIVDKLQNIQLEYNGKKITQTVSYFKGLFSNIGNEDVSLKSSQSEEGISIKLPDECKWLSVNLKEHSDKLNVEFSIDTDDASLLHVCGGVFRRDELFSFDAFIEGELTKQKVHEKKLGITHRIANAENIKVETMYDIKKDRFNRAFFMSSSIFGILFFGIFAFMFYSMSLVSPVRYIDKTENEGNSIPYAAFVCDSDTIAVVCDDDMVIWPWSKNRYSFEEFSSRFTLSTYISTDRKWMCIIMMVVMILFVLIFAVGLYGQIKETYRRNIRDQYLKILDGTSSKNLDQKKKK